MKHLEVIRKDKNHCIGKLYLGNRVRWITPHKIVFWKFRAKVYKGNGGPFACITDAKALINDKNLTVNVNPVKRK